MSSTTLPTMDRRSFLRLSGITGGGLVLGLYLRGESTAEAQIRKTSAADQGFAPNAFVRIAPDGTVSIWAVRAEGGQGIRTSLPMVVAEELEVDWKDVTVIVAPLDPMYGGQTAGGSTSTPTSYLPMRQAGASARLMLTEAAAQTWGVPASECYAENAAIHHRPTGRSLRYRDLVSKASALPLPDVKQLSLKDPKDFKLLGKRISQVDNPRIVTGKPLFGIDQKIPGMLYAVYQKCPVFGGKVVSANLDHVKSLPGVRDAFVIEGTQVLNGLMPGVAILATSTWAALSARKELQVTWDEGAFATHSWKGYQTEAQNLRSQAPHSVLHEEGEVDKALTGAAKVVTADYSYPYISHANLEPQNCTALVSGDSVELWAPTQNPSSGQTLVADTLGFHKDKVKVNIIRCGGGFGRRLNCEYMVEAAAIAQRAQVPVKLQWTREDDLGHDQFRPPGFFFLKAGIDSQGKVSVWTHHYVSTGYSEKKAYAAPAADEFPSRFIPNYRAVASSILCKVPMGPWRAPGSCTNAWVIQSFIDELAAAAGRDPVDLRMELLGTKDILPGIGEKGRPYNAARMRGVLMKVAEMSQWGKKTFPKGTGQGVAFHFSHQGYIAEVAEVSVSQSGDLKVNQVYAAVDVGSQIVNLSGAENQVEGSIIDGMSAAWYQELNIDKGRIVQTNFHEYPLLRIPDAPDKITIEFVKTHYPPTGLGEPCLPPIAPAVCNAIFAATGKRIRQLPFSKTDLSWS